MKKTQQAEDLQTYLNDFVFKIPHNDYYSNRVEISWGLGERKYITPSEFVNRLAKTHDGFASVPLLKAEGGNLVHKDGRDITKIKKSVFLLYKAGVEIPDGTRIAFCPAGRLKDEAICKVKI